MSAKTNTFADEKCVDSGSCGDGWEPPELYHCNFPYRLSKAELYAIERALAFSAATVPRHG